MTALPSELVLGGWRATWVWASTYDESGAAKPAEGNVPAAILIDHGDHTCLVPWVRVDDAHAVFTLDSLLPLTVVEPVTCTLCGAVGRIKQGAWLPAEGGAGRG